MADEIDPAKLDLIQMVQRARMQHDSAAVPSQAALNYWIETKRAATDQGASPTAHTGQWVLTCSIEQVDALWKTIKAATEEGKLGYKSKVAVVSHRDPTGCILYIRTYNADDLEDRQRVYAALRALGITHPLSYEYENESEQLTERDVQSSENSDHSR